MTTTGLRHASSTWPEPQPPRWTEAAGGLDRGRVWFARLRELPWQPPEPVRLPFIRDAQMELQRWREEAAGMEEGAAGLFLSWLGKLPGFAVRLSVVFEHLAWMEREGADPPERIGASALLRAVGFLDGYAVPMVRRVFGEATLPEAERDARVLARRLLRQRPRPAVLNVRELRRMAGGPGISTPARVEAALGELEALGWVRSTPARDGAPGHARNDWTVNPAITGDGDGLA